MWRLTSWFFVGVLVSALFVNALSVYVFHDVDREMIGRWHEAYFQLNIELLFFSLIVTGLLLLFMCLGIKLFRYPVFSQNVRLAFTLGVGTILIQYVYDLAARSWAPEIAQVVTAIYPLLGSAISAIILIRNGSHPSPSAASEEMKNSITN
jgi:hypothetical protein